MTSLMIVDDEQIVRTSVRRALRDAGFSSIYEASNGRDALDQLTVLAASDELPALVITDCSMPDMGGIELASQMRESTDLRAIPIIVCSGDDGNAILAHKLKLPFFNKGGDSPETLKRLVQEATK